METITYAVYLRQRDAFGSEYHTLYTNGLTLEQAQSDMRNAAGWQTPGTTLMIVKEIKQVELLEGPEFQTTVGPRAGAQDWDE